MFAVTGLKEILTPRSKKIEKAEAEVLAAVADKEVIDRRIALDPWVDGPSGWAQDRLDKAEERLALLKGDTSIRDRRLAQESEFKKIARQAERLLSERRHS